MVEDTPLFRVIRTTAIPPRQIELKSCFDRKLNYFTRRDLILIRIYCHNNLLHHHHHHHQHQHYPGGVVDLHLRQEYN